MSVFCRFCLTPLLDTFADLGMSPLANNFLTQEKLHNMEPFFPLHAFVCRNCLLVQLEEFESPDGIFSNYAYFSSYSPSWLEHARAYVEMMLDRFNIDDSTQVVEIASNDGYLLQYFQEKSIPSVGIEPAANVANDAIKKGIKTFVKFFGVDTATELQTNNIRGDLIIGNNVLAHVPDINDFVAGLKILLSENGIITLEFPHILKLIQQCQFDTIYHEHFSYFSFLTVEAILRKHGLMIFDVEELKTHGGSLRLFCCHDNAEKEEARRVGELKKTETEAGLDQIDVYLGFPEKINKLKRELLEILIALKNQNKSIAAYGAPAKGNTLLNYCGISKDFIDYTVDRSPHKQNCYLPGTHIPVNSTEHINKTRPDYILVLPWNLREQITRQLAYTRKWDCKLVIPIPAPVILNEF